MKIAVGTIVSLALTASIASAQGNPGGGGAGGGVGTGGGGAVGGRGAISGGVGQPTVLAPGGVSSPAPGVVGPGVPGSAPTAIQPQPGIGQPLTTTPPGAGTPSPGAPATGGVGQPLMTQPPQQPGAGTQLGAGIGSQPGGFGSQPGPQPGTSGVAQQPGGTAGGSPFPLTGVAPLPPGAPAPPGPVAPATPPVSPPSPGALMIPAPTTSTTAPVASATTTAMPPDAVGVAVEGMMLAEVIGVDTERGCITVRALDGDTASYRIDRAGDRDTSVAVGEPVVIEVARPLFASASDAPSASPRMTEPKAARPSAAASPTERDVRARGTDTGTRTTISTVARATVISRDAVSCGPR